MDNYELSSKLFLSKIEDCNIKFYYDISRRIHSYFGETLYEVQQHLQQLKPQEMNPIEDGDTKYEKLLHNHGLLEKNFQQLQQTIESQQTTIKQLKEDNEKLSKKIKGLSTNRKTKEKNETASLNNNEEPDQKTNTRSKKNLKNIETVTLVEDEHLNRFDDSPVKDLEQTDEYGEEFNQNQSKYDDI